MAKRIIIKFKPIRFKQKQLLERNPLYIGRYTPAKNLDLQIGIDFFLTVLCDPNAPYDNPVIHANNEQEYKKAIEWTTLNGDIRIHFITSQAITYQKLRYKMAEICRDHILVFDDMNFIAFNSNLIIFQVK